MKTYQFESIIEENGIIVLPQYMKRLKKHRVKLTVVDLEPFHEKPVKLLGEITRKYEAIDEEDLDITGIYEQRDKQEEKLQITNHKLQANHKLQ